MLSEHFAALPVESREGGGPSSRNIVDLSNALARKQQVLSIHVTRLHEAAGFLGASAGVGRVHEPALVIHEAMQVAARAGQALPEPVRGDREKFGTDRVGDPEDLSEDVDDP